MAYKENKRRVKRRKHDDESRGSGNAKEEVVFSPRKSLRVNVFIIIIDNLKSDLEK